jgi:hypothetical protein
MRYVSVAVVAALAAAAFVGNARAEDAANANGFAKRLFAEHFAAGGKSYACFTRRYERAHLAKHPRQKTTAMKLLVTAELVPEDKALNYSFAMGVTFRDRKGKFDTSGSCGHPTASQESADKLTLGCGVDCDGGGLSVELANADKSVLVRLGQIALWNGDKPDDERTGFDAGPDDHVFRLDRVSLDNCRSLMPNSDEFTADQRK